MAPPRCSLIMGACAQSVKNPEAGSPLRPFVLVCPLHRVDLCHEFPGQDNRWRLLPSDSVRGSELSLRGVVAIVGPMSARKARAIMTHNDKLDGSRLEGIPGRGVDLVTPDALKQRLPESILREAVRAA